MEAERAEEAAERAKHAAELVASYTKGYNAGLAHARVFEGQSTEESGMMAIGEGSFGRISTYSGSAIAYKSTLHGPDAAGRRALFREFAM